MSTTDQGATLAQEAAIAAADKDAAAVDVATLRAELEVAQAALLAREAEERELVMAQQRAAWDARLEELDREIAAYTALDSESAAELEPLIAAVVATVERGVAAGRHAILLEAERAQIEAMRTSTGTGPIGITPRYLHGATRAAVESGLILNHVCVSRGVSVA